MRIWNKDTKVNIGFQFDSATRYSLASKCYKSGSVTIFNRNPQFSFNRWASNLAKQSVGSEKMALNGKRVTIKDRPAQIFFCSFI